MKNSRIFLVITFFTFATASTVVYAKGRFPSDFPTKKAEIIDAQKVDLALKPSQILEKKPINNLEELPKVLENGKGIVETRQGPFPPFEFEVNNEWSGIVRGKLYMVFAGNTRNEDGSIGNSAIRIYSQTLSEQQSGTSTFIGTFEHFQGGSFRIIQEQAQTLQLVNTVGDNSFFDLIDLKFK